jgi:hypothetical protein
LIASFGEPIRLFLNRQQEAARGDCGERDKNEQQSLFRDVN